MDVMLPCEWLQQEKLWQQGKGGSGDEAGGEEKAERSLWPQFRRDEILY